MAENKKLVNGTGLAQGLQGVYTKAKGYADSVVGNEKSRAEGVESGLDTRITALEGKFNGDESVDSKIAAAQAAAEAKAAELDNALKTDLEGKIATAKSGAEQTAANALAEAKGDLEGKINLKADKTALEAEVTARGEAETALGERIDGVVESVSDLDAAYKAADTALDGRVGELEEAVEAINNGTDGVLAQAKAYTDQEIGKEVTARDGAIKTAKEALQQEIDDDVLVEKQRAEGQEAAIRGEFAAADTQVLKDAKAYADEKIADLVDAAPDDLNTLNELAQSIKTHATEYEAYVTTVNGKIATAKQEAIDAAAEAAAAKDTALHKTISAEIDADVKAEADRAKAEEAAIREEFAAADTALDGRIDTLTGTVNDIDAAYKAADTSIKGRLDTLEATVNGEGEGSVHAKVQEVQTQLTEFKSTQEANNATQQAAIEKAQGDATKALADAATAKAQADKGVEDAATAKAQADKGVADAAAAKAQADKGVADAATAQADATKALEDAAAAQGDVDALETRVESAEGKITTIEGQVSDLEQADADLRSDVVNTFKALELEVGDGTIQLVLKQGQDGQMDGAVTAPLSSLATLPVMTTEEVDAIVNALQ